MLLQSPQPSIMTSQTEFQSVEDNALALLRTLRSRRGKAHMHLVRSALLLSSAKRGTKTNDGEVRCRTS